jgi:signal transduction histidine kinase
VSGGESTSSDAHGQRRFGPRVLGMVVVATIPLLLLAGITLWSGARAQEARVVADHEALAGAAALSAAAFLDGNLSTVRTLAHAPLLARPGEPLVAGFLDAALRENDDWEGLGLAAPDGWNIVSTHAAPGTLSIADRPYFQEVISTGRAVVSPAVLNRRTGNPTIVLAAPIEYTTGGRGALIVSLSSASLARSLAALGAQRSVRIVVLDRDGKVFIHPERETAAALPSLAGRPEVMAARGGRTGSNRADALLTAYAPVPAAGWVVLVEETEAAAFGAVRQSLAIQWALLVAAALVTVAIGWYLGGRLARSYERELAARRQVEAALRARDDFLAAASHDLKSPLTTLKGLAQLLERRTTRATLPDSDWLLDGLRRIDRLAGKMAGQVNELLDVARLQVNQPLALDCRPVDLVALVRATVAEHEQVATEHQFAVETAESQIVGEWDAARIERVIDNLIGNAVKYSPGGGPVTIALGREHGPDGDRAVVVVRDRGLGIPPADLPRIFNRFHRAANVTGRIAGSGIGLSGSRQIVEQHGGTIAVESTLGAGATFTVRLPLPAPAVSGTSSAA